MGLLDFLKPNVKKLAAKHDLEELIKVLCHRDTIIRRSAIDALLKLGDPRSVDLLCSALKNSNKDMRYWSAEVLGYIRDARSVEPLIAALKDSDKYVRQAATESLGKIRDVCSVEPLITALKDSYECVRYCAADALGKIRDVRSVEPLIAALKDSEFIVRMHAAVALGKIRDARSVEPLITALKDSDERVCEKAAEALRIIDSPDAKKTIEQHKKSNVDWRHLTAAVCDIGSGITTCVGCGKRMEVSLSLSAKGERRVAQCRVCPANRIFAICEDCVDLNQVQQAACPSCGAQHMWEIISKVPL